MTLHKILNFELSNLLKEKGLDKPLSSEGFYWTRDGNSVQPYYWFLPEELSEYVPALTIAEAIDWVYEKHNLWIVVNFANKNQWYFDINRVGFDGKHKKLYQSNYSFETPLEAYEQSIRYIYNHLK